MLVMTISSYRRQASQLPWPCLTVTAVSETNEYSMMTIASNHALDNPSNANQLSFSYTAKILLCRVLPMHAIRILILLKQDNC